MKSQSTQPQTFELQATELQALEPSKAEQIKATFEPMVLMLEDFETRYNEIVAQEITEEITKQAKRLRLDIAKVRIETEKVRKAQKEEFLRAGKAIDGVANILKWAVTEKENKLKEIEDYYIIQEQKRKEALQKEREELLAEFVEDAHERDLASMEQDVWQAYFDTKKADFFARQEAERKAEEERQRLAQEQALHQERREQLLPFFQFWNEQDKAQNFGQITEDNFKEIYERLKAEHNAHQKEMERIRVENERLAKEKAKAEEKARKERQKIEAERRAKELELLKEQQERQRLEAELKRQQEAERLRLEKEAQERKAEEERKKKEAEKRAKAPLKKRLTLWVDEFTAPEAPVQNEKTELIKQKFEAFKKWAKNEIENL